MTTSICMSLHIYTPCNSVSCYIGAVTNDHQYLLLVLKHSVGKLLRNSKRYFKE